MGHLEHPRRDLYPRYRSDEGEVLTLEERAERQPVGLLDVLGAMMYSPTLKGVRSDVDITRIILGKDLTEERLQDVARARWGSYVISEWDGSAVLIKVEDNLARILRPHDRPSDSWTCATAKASS